MSGLSLYSIWDLYKSGADNTKVTMALMLPSMSSSDGCQMTWHDISFPPSIPKELDYIYTGVTTTLL